MRNNAENYNFKFILIKPTHLTLWRNIQMKLVNIALALTLASVQAVKIELAVSGYDNFEEPP